MSHRLPVGRLYGSFLLTVVFSRAIVQTDIIFLSRMSEDGLFAYSSTMNLMFFGTVIALSWIPIVTTNVVAAGESTKNSFQVTGRIVLFSLVLGMVVALVGLPLYTVLLRLTLDSDHIALSQKFVTLLTLMTPIQFLHFTGCFIFHARRSSRVPLINYALMAVMNLILNLLFGRMFGPIGIVYSTLLGYVLFTVLLYLPLASTIQISLSKSLRWGVSQLTNLFWEVGRISTEKVYLLLVFIIFNKWKPVNLSSVIGAYTIAMSIYLFLSIFTIATLRTTPILLARSGEIGAIEKRIWKAILLGVPVTVGLVVSMFKGYFPQIYDIKNLIVFEKWTNPFFKILPLILLLDSLAARLIGELHFRGSFKSLSIYKALITSVFQTPIAFWGVSTSNPWLFWTSTVLAQSFIIVSCILKLRRITHHGTS